jgi:hypothetical protein
MEVESLKTKNVNEKHLQFVRDKDRINNCKSVGAQTGIPLISIALAKVP